MKITKAELSIPEIGISDNYSENEAPKSYNFYSLGLQIIMVLLLISGLSDTSLFYINRSNNLISSELKGKEIKNGGKYNILSSEDVVKDIKDTIYTDKDCWLELRIDQQMLYQHWRDGTTQKYPVSSGNNKGNDPEALESRPGLFAIFLKIEHHQSSQFESANMYHFMPFNQGIGFHSIDGTGYYSHLGVRPSSHGCIRMKHENAEKLFNDCELGTLVLASKGYSARTVAFAEENFKNTKDYTKEEYKVMLASNLYNILNGKYYLGEREKFVIDPKVIPVSGIYTSYDVEIPDNQIIPRNFLQSVDIYDKTYAVAVSDILKDEHSEEFFELAGISSEYEENQLSNNKVVNSTSDLVKQYFNNPIGILPYFGPKR